MTVAPVPAPGSICLAINDAFGSKWRDRVTAELGAAAIADGRDPASLAAAEYALAWSPEPGFLSRLPKLRAIFSVGAGVDHLLKDPDLPDVPIVRFVDPDMTTRMGEWVLLQTLSHHRAALDYRRQQEASVWREISQPPANEVSVGIMGLGTLGSHACRLLNAVGYRVLGWSRHDKRLPDVECFSGSEGLKPFLRQTAILVCLLPHTPETEGLIDARLLDRLGRDTAFGPYLINAGRGKLQKEQDISDALDSGRLKGASLDVFSAEPLPADSPLWSHPQVIVTPHVAAASSPQKLARSVLRGIALFESGGTPRHIVDRKLGY